MKKYYSIRGLTLVELLVTTSIVGIIALGMVSIDYALRTNEEQQSRSALVSLRTSATLTDIASNARQAVGDVATQCIQLAASMATDLTNYICVYRDIDYVTSVRNETAFDTADDIWICYTRRGTDLHKCRMIAANGPNACTAGDPIIGTVTTDAFGVANPVLTSTDPDFDFQISIKNRFNAAQARAYITNPEVTITTSVMPQGCRP